MTDTTQAGTETGGEPIAVIEAPADARAEMGPRAAAQLLASLRHKRTEEASPSAQNDKAHAEMASSAVEREVESDQSATESGETQDAAPPEQEATGETQAIDPAEQQPLDLPRSWTKDRAEHWAKLDRATQEFLLEHDRKASAEVRRSQNEAADQRKAMEAERSKVEQARQQYETALPALLATLEQQQQGEFADIKTMDDVTRLAQTDWPRYVLWDAQQKRVAAVQQQVKAATERQHQEKQQKLAEFVQNEAKQLAEKAPEVSDPTKRADLQKSAVALMRDLGFSDAEMNDLWQGNKEISLHDHRLQLLIRDGIKYRAGQTAIKAPAKPLPPVQRPGTSQARGVQQGADVANLAKRLDQTGNVKDAARLLAARRAARQ